METGIALADCRAGSEELAEIVNRVIAERVDGSQLSGCDLTLRDLEIIRETFTSALKGTFHPRIEYPPSGKVADT